MPASTPNADDVRRVLRTAIVMGSTRPGRKSDAVARWVHEVGRERAGLELELVDPAEYRLPLLDEPWPAAFGEYTCSHTRAWSERIASFDAYVFVVPEYNHGPPAALKNAIDFLYGEWNNKAAGIVSYGSSGGGSAADQLRLVLAHVMVATVRAQVGLSLFTDFESFTTFVPAPRRAEELNAMFNQIVAWGRAMRIVRDLTNRGLDREATGREAA